MGARVVIVVVYLVVVMMMGEGAKGDEVIICGMSKDGLDSCRPAVTGLNPSPPSKPCCLALSNANLPCLCSFKNSKLLGDKLGINFARAMELPALCNIDKSFHC